MNPPRRKRVFVEGYGPLAAGRHHPTTWDDVWIAWRKRPGRPQQRLAPTLVGFEEFTAQESGFPEDQQSNAEIRRQLEAAEPPYVIDEIDPPNIYTRAATIDRAEAERMLAYLMEQRYGIRNPKFRWKHRGSKDFVLVPATIPVAP